MSTDSLSPNDIKRYTEIENVNLIKSVIFLILLITLLTLSLKAHWIIKNDKTVMYMIWFVNASILCKFL